MDSQTSKIESILPSKWKSQILEKEVIEGEDSFPNVELKILVNIKSQDEFKEWLIDFENNTCSSYIISHTDIKGGKKMLFKQRLRCHHFTGCKKVYDPSVKNKTRNTNCPAKMTVKIYNVKPQYRGANQEKYQLLKEMPCEIIFILTHNHPTGTADSLRFRKVSESVKEELLELFSKGHNTKTALDMIRVKLQLHSEDPKTVLSDRNLCPDYNFCYNLYIKEFKKKHEDIIPEMKQIQFLEKKIAQYNVDQKDECVKIIIRREYRNDDVIGIVTPIMKRINTYLDAASQTVIIDSSGKLDKDGRRVFLLLTHSDCGALPLGLIIATEDVEDLSIGFGILKEILGESMFRGHLEGPKVVMTNESSAEQNAIGYICRHIDLATMLFYNESSAFQIDNKQLRQKYYFIATGQNGLVIGLIPLKKKTETNIGNSVNTVASPVTQAANLSVPPPLIFRNNIGMEETKKERIDEDYIRQFNNTFSKISKVFYGHLKESPQELLVGAQKMLENMQKIRNPSDLANAMTNFGCDK